MRIEYANEKQSADQTNVIYFLPYRKQIRSDRLLPESQNKNNKHGTYMIEQLSIV